MIIKLRLLLLVFILNGLSLQAQGGPPPPCGLTPEYICDDNEDGQIEIDLTVLYPFRFCVIPVTNAVFYEPITYYFTEEDANAQTNAISNPENFITSITSQTIYRRANPIDPTTYPMLVAYDPLEIVLPPSSSNPTSLIVCDFDGDGFATFNLFSKTEEILASQGFEYSVRYYETIQDANDNTNSLSSSFVNSTAFQQTIFVRVSNMTALSQYQCVNILELDLIVNDFCEDVEVFLVNSWAPPRPGFDYRHQLVFRNNGSTDVASGSISYTHDEDLNIVNVFPYDGTDTVNLNSNGFTLDFINLESDEVRVVDVILNCPVSTSLGEVLTSSASYITDSEDVIPSNHNPILMELVVGAYDPNDKAESRGRTIILEDFSDDDYLYYTIRFQNLGTAPAENVRIEDQLNSQLDASTFQRLHESDPGGITRVGGLLTWTFNNINLPAEQDDAEGSTGYVHFKIKPKVGVVVGDIIPNSAAIYFDFNAPIITNIFETEFIEDSTLSTSQLANGVFDIFPNPAKDKVTIRWNANNFGNVTINIIDLQGKLILEEHISEGNNLELDIADLQSGLYFVKLNANNKNIVKKLIIE
jgi:hypothetical protein